MENLKHTHTHVCEADDHSSEKISVHSEEQRFELAEFFKAFSDMTRVGVLLVLDSQESCVCDIAAALGMTKSAVSHQLKLLRQARLVKYRKEGKHVIYSLADDHVRIMIEMALEHVRE